MIERFSAFSIERYETRAGVIYLFWFREINPQESQESKDCLEIQYIIVKEDTEVTVKLKAITNKKRTLSVFFYLFISQHW